MVTGGSCTACGVDEYQNKVGQTTCLNCEEGYSTHSKTGRSSCDLDAVDVIEELEEGWSIRITVYRIFHFFRPYFFFICVYSKRPLAV